MTNFRTIFLILFLLSNTRSVLAITSSIQNGKWLIGSTWDNGVPTCGDTVYISSGDIVTIANHVDYTGCGLPMFIVVEGTIQFGKGKKLKLPCGSGVLVKVGGQILTSTGKKGGNNQIEICGVEYWRSGDGDIGTPTYLGSSSNPPFTEKIISVASTDWGITSTWDCGCDPQFYHDVTIDLPHTVTLSSNPTINSLRINGVLDASGYSGNLNVNGNWNNSNSFLPGLSTITLQGGIAQLISGTNNFYNLTLNNSSGASIFSGNVNMIGSLTLTLGNFSTNNSILFISDANGTARIGEITGGSISGNITMQRYIDAGATDWRFYTSPISGATLADLNDDFITSGFTGSDWPLWPTAANPWPSIYYYDETELGIQDSGFVPASNITNLINPGQGIWIWSGDTSTGTQPFTIDVTGPPNVGNVNIPMTFTSSGFPSDDGWNMLGNPYPSTLDWDDPSISKSNINHAIYIWNPDLQQFGSYVGGFGTNGATNNIASSQAFWVQATAPSPSIIVTEASKTSVDAAFLKPLLVQPFRIKSTNNYGTDEIVIHFDNNATNGFDPQFDAQKMSSLNTSLPRVASILNNIEYSVNQFPEQEINIPIKITCDLSGLQTISIENAGAFGNTACLILEDLFTGTVYDLNTVQSFTSFISDTTSIARFLLHIGAPITINTTDISCFGNNDAEIIFTKNTANPFDIDWKDANSSIISSNTNIFSDTLTNLTNGTYYIETTDISCGNRIDTITITQPSPITSNFSVVSDTILLGDDLTPTNLSNNAISYLWDFGDGNTSTVVNPTYTYPQIGNYLVNLNASQNTNCFENFTKLITVVNITGINDLTNNAEVSTWLNNDVLTIELNNNSFERIELRNALGQIVYTNLINTNTFKIDMSKFSKGIYVITLSDDNNSSKSFKVAYSK